MCRPARAVVVLLLLHCGAHAQSEMFSMRQAQSIFSIWGNDCHLPLNDTQREVEDERVEATGRPPPEQAPPCPDGYSCRRCFSRKDCKEDQGQCAPCNYLGEYCPEGTVNEYSYVQASNCPAGKMCPNTTTMEECKPGYFCPGAIFAYIDALKCDEEIGLYCPAGSKTNTTGCKAGFYCPTPDQQLLCPENYFCRPFSIYPRQCPISSNCPAGSEVPLLSFGGIAIAMVMLSLLMPVLLYVQYRKNRTWSRNNLRLARLLQRQENCSVFVEDVLCIKQIEKMMVGNNIVGFSKKLYPVEISFHNLRLELPNGVVPLADVSGTFQHSHITAIMGNSGSGKSTLVKTLLGFSHQGKVSGVTTINGKPARLERIKKVSAFVQQDDLLVPFADLTVAEILRCSAKLRLPASKTSLEQKLIVDGCLQLLNLIDVQHMRVGGVGRGTLSGGQRRRVNIGMELVVDPTALYLDEPTSGLSSSDSMLIMKAMWSLSCLQCTIVAIIHSPPVMVWKMFTDVLLLARGGHVAFFGPVNSVMRYWNHIGFNIGSEMTNAPDFCLDVLTGQVVPKNVHQKYHASGRYNPNDYVIAMWEMLHVQDGKEAAGGRLNTLMNLASIVAKQTVLERESTMSPMKALHAELPPEEANQLIRVVSRGDLTRGVTRREGGGDEELLSYSVHSESPKRPHVESRNWLSGIGILFSFGNNEPPPKRLSQVTRRHSLPATSSPERLAEEESRHQERGYMANSLSWLSFPSLENAADAAADPPARKTALRPSVLDPSLSLSSEERRRKANAEAMSSAAHDIWLKWEGVCDEDGVVTANEILRLFASKDIVLDEQEVNDVMAEIDQTMMGHVCLGEFLDYVNRLRILYDGTGYTLTLDDDGMLVARETTLTTDKTTMLLRAASINTVGDRNVATMAVQMKALVLRALQQYTRKTRVHTGSAIILVVGGMVVGLLRSYSNDLKDTPSTMCLVCTVMGVLSSSASLGYFGNEKLLHLQETRGGVNPVAYFLSKNVVVAVDNLLHPLLFYAAYTQFVYSNLDFVTFWMHLVAVGFATNGVGMTLSIALGSDTALLGSALVPLVFGVFLGGIDPRVLALKNPTLEFLSYLSFARWATEALTVYELSIEDEADQLRVALIYERFGFREDRYYLCTYMLVIIGLFWRLLALVLLVSEHEIKALMQLLPDNEMEVGLFVRDQWTKCSMWLRRCFGITIAPDTMGERKDQPEEAHVGIHVEDVDVEGAT